MAGSKAILPQNNRSLIPKTTAIALDQIEQLSQGKGDVRTANAVMSGVRTIHNAVKLQMTFCEKAGIQMAGLEFQGPGGSDRKPRSLKSKVNTTKVRAKKK
jgi:hypothetical protein